ncbi:MAG TPA: hypothetical protein VFG43_08790 [Geminicoccaceae bacterium]|nr:hypothetical protein [Geminicoccaceae bacterium]
MQADDLPAVWRFCAQSYGVFRGCSYQEFRDLWDHRWRHNPAAHPGQPLGWVLETLEAEVVGFAGLVPLRLKIGPESLVAFCGANWSVHPAYRQHSLAIFRQYTALGESHVVLSTGVRPAAAILHARAMQRIPVDGIDRALWWIIDPKRFLAWKVAQLGAASRVWRAVAAAPVLGALGAAWPVALGICTDPERRVLPWLGRARIAFDCRPLAVERVTWFTAEFDRYWSEHRRRCDVTVERDSEFLNWRHVLLPEAAGECFALACRDRGRLLGYATLQTPGYHGRLPGCFTVTDLFYPPEREDVLGNLMNAAFRFAVERGGTVLKLSGFHPAVHAALASQRPIVIAPDTLRTLLPDGLGRGLLAGSGLGRKTRPAARRLPEGSYWYKVPTAELARICRSGSWWPSGIDGTSNL